MPAHFFNHDVVYTIKQKRKLSVFLDQLVQEYLVGIKKIKLNYIFCSDEHLLGINQQFLQHDTYTDIITFDLSESESELVGEIYISIDRVADNARRFRSTEAHELHRVIFHGCLHLCGLGDKKAADKKNMRDAEDKCLAAYFAE